MIFSLFLLQKTGFNPLTPRVSEVDNLIFEFRHCIIPNKGLSQTINRMGNKCRSWWDGSLWALSSGSTLHSYLCQSTGLKSFNIWKPLFCHKLGKYLKNIWWIFYPACKTLKQLSQLSLFVHLHKSSWSCTQHLAYIRYKMVKQIETCVPRPVIRRRLPWKTSNFYCCFLCLFCFSKHALN